MKTLPKHSSPILFGLICSFFLVSCSVEQKQDSMINPDQTIISEPKTPEVIGLPPEITYIPEEIPTTKKPLSEAQLFAGTLDAHNRVRAKHRLAPLKWSDKLAAYSQEWANHLGKGSRCVMRHRGGTPPYGENLYWSGPVEWSDGAREVNRVTIRNVVKAWTDEEQWYNYNSNSCQPGKRCGHYTQAVWKNTTEVGCAMKICDDKSQTWVCSYNPPGNFTGMRPY